MMLLLLALAQDFKPDYTKEVAKINKEYARGLLGLVASPLKAKRYAEARQDLAKALDLDPTLKDAKKALEKIEGRADEGPDEDKAYSEAKRKLRDSISDKFGDLARTMQQKRWDAESEDARSKARALRTEIDLGGRSAASVMLKRLNEIRAGLGLAPVEIDEALSKGCDLHARYLVNNEGNPRLEGLGAHNEDPALVGYTPEGEKAGHASVIAFYGVDRAVDGWLDTFFHRIPLLHPNLKKIGGGYCSGGRSGHVSLLDCQSNVGGDAIDPKLAIIAYPPDGAKGVGLQFYGEHPDPRPDTNVVVGYPVTLSFFDHQAVTEVVAELRAGTPPKSPKEKPGKLVDCHVSTPAAPACPKEDRDNSNTICLLPKLALGAGATYTVSIKAKVNEQPFEKTWSFTTK